MATWTSTQLATEVLKRLAVLASGQQATAEDLGKVTGKWPSVWQNLRSDQIAPFPQEAIPIEAQDAVANIMAYRCLKDFGITGERAARIENDAIGQMNPYSAMSVMRREYSADNKRLPTRARYF